MKVLVIGAGTMGSVHARAYTAMPDVELVGVVDPRVDAARSLAEQCRTHAYASLPDALASASPDVVDICVPTSKHLSCIQQAAAAGAHVICEKPLALTMEDAKTCLRSCSQAGVRLFVAHVVRFFPEYRLMKEMVDSGAIGTVGVVRASRGGVFPRGWNDWYAHTRESGSLIVDLMIHDFDYLRWCFGDVLRVYAKSLTGRELNRLDHAFVTLRFANGVMALVEGTWSAPSGFATELEMAGTRGVLEYRSADSAAVRLVRRNEGGGPAAVAVPESPLERSPYELELAHFLECIRTGAEPLVTAEDAVRSLEISLAAVESIRTGLPVTLGPQGGVH